MHTKREGGGKSRVPSTQSIKSEQRHRENRFPLNVCHAKQKECQYWKHKLNVPQNKHVQEDAALAGGRVQGVQCVKLENTSKDKRLTAMITFFSLGVILWQYPSNVDNKSL